MEGSCKEGEKMAMEKRKEKRKKMEKDGGIKLI